MFRRLALPVLLLASCCNAVAADLTLLVGDNRPFNFMEAGRPQGMASEIVAEMLERAGLTANYDSYPWARSHMLAQRKPAYCLYTLGRIPEREALFQWVGPMGSNKWAFFALRSRHLKLRSLDEARRYRISTQRETARALWLADHGFKPDPAATAEQSFRKLLAGHVDLYAAGLYGVDDLAQELNIDPKLVQPVLVFNQVDNYLGCSPATDKAVIEKLRKALASMQADKTLARILAAHAVDLAPPEN